MATPASKRRFVRLGQGGALKNENCTITAARQLRRGGNECSAGV
jgi:hypothetical protein